MLSLTFRSSLKIYDKKLGFKEPSGISLDPDTGELWSISDDTGRLFCLGKPDRIEATKGPKIKAEDLEGIACLASGLVAVAQEKANAVTIFDRFSGKKLRHAPLSEMKGYGDVQDAFEHGEKGKGLEGVAVIPESGRFLLVKEGRPRLLLEVSEDLDEVVSWRELSSSDGFAVEGVSDKKLDISDVAWDGTRNLMWLVSDTGRCVFFLNPIAGDASKLHLLSNSDDDAKAVENAEGLSLSQDGRTLYVITDDGKNSLLLTYEIGG